METFLDNSIKALGFEPLSTVGEVAHRIGAVHFYRLAVVFWKNNHLFQRCEFRSRQLAGIQESDN